MSRTDPRQTEFIPVASIVVASRARSVRDDGVEQLMKSMDEIGMKTPITVRYYSDRPNEELGTADSLGLVAGAHRLESARRLGWEKIECFVVEEHAAGLDEERARMWEISENLHRAELTALERSEHIAEWATLAEKVSQLVTPLGGLQPADKGIRKAAKELGINQMDAQRAVKVAGLSDEAKAAAREAGLDNNRSALLSAAAAPDPVARISELAAAKVAKPFKLAADPTCDVQANESQVARLMSAWNAAGPDARQEFLSRIDTPIMDRQYA